MRLKKREVERHPVGSVLYVLAHAIHKRSKGRNPSVQYKGIRNPRKALQEAIADAEMELLFTIVFD